LEKQYGPDGFRLLYTLLDITVVRPCLSHKTSSRDVGFKVEQILQENPFQVT
jgi:hypothetical protein